MIKQISLDKAPYEKFLLNFSKLVSSCDEKNLILLNSNILDFISVFSKSNSNLSLNSSVSLEANPMSLYDNLDDKDSLVTFRITDTQKHSWFFNAVRISDDFSVLKYFSCSYMSLYYNSPKKAEDIHEIYEIKV